MMYLSIGNDFLLRARDVILVLDADTATRQSATKRLLAEKQKAGLVLDASDTVPLSMILAGRGKQEETVLYLSRLSTKALRERAEEKRKERIWYQQTK